MSGLEEGYFPVDILPQPTGDNHKDVAEQVVMLLAAKDYAGVWIEPLTQRGMQFVPQQFLCALKKACQKKRVPLIYNETASSGFAYTDSHYFVSSHEDWTPDGGFAYLGGQGGMVFCRPGIWVPDKLKMISTWDGDEFSFANYHRVMQIILQNPAQYKKDVKRFDKALKSLLSKCPVEEMSLCRGRGRWKGGMPLALQQWFERRDGYFLSDPSYCQLKRFLAEHGQ